MGLKQRDAEALTAFIGRHLDKIAKAFVPGVKLTLVARFDGEPEQDLFVSSDDVDEVAKAVERARTREEVRGG